MGLEIDVGCKISFMSFSFRYHRWCLMMEGMLVMCCSAASLVVPSLRVEFVVATLPRDKPR